MFVSVALNYYGIVQMPCAQQTMTRDYLSLPPWLIGPSGISVLANRSSDMNLPSFLAE
jgi:hypothetical protein